MNLGQLIDPEWVQQGYPERFPRRPRAPEPLQTRTRADGLDQVETREPARPVEQPPRKHGGGNFKYATGHSLAILRVLASRDQATTSAVVAALLAEGIESDSNRASAYLSQLWAQRAVTRGGEPRQRTYSITDHGRSRIPPT